MSLVPLADVKAHLNITTADAGGRDAKLQLKIDAAEAWVSLQLGGPGSLAVQTITQRATGFRSMLTLTTRPVVSVTSVTGSDGVAIPLGSLDVDTDAGIVQSLASYYYAAQFFPFTLPFYTVVYQAGYANLAALPADVVEAVKLETQSMWETQRGSRTGSDITSPSDAHARAVRILDNRPVVGFA